MTTKRARIEFNDSAAVMRISVAGVDVEEAEDYEFLLHEEHLYSQPFFWTFVACPFAGYTGSASQSATVSVAFPDTGTVPICILYPVASTGDIVFPYPVTQASGSNENGWPGLQYWSIHHEIDETGIDITFSKGTDSRRSPNGCYVLLMRVPDA